ncbi:MAG: hypothetical protein V4590_03780 [Bacteroidota bacterium]
MKTLTQTLLLLFVATACLQPALAQDAKNNDNRKAKHEQRFKAASERLNLTTDQQAKLKAVLKQNKTEMKTLREANKDKAKDEKRKVMIAQMKKADGQVSAILDSKQQEIYKQMKEEKKAEMKKKREEHMKMKEELEGEEGIF